MGIKASDATAIPLCFRCHRERHDKGYRSFWGESDVEDIIKRLNEAYEKETGRKIG